MFLWVQGIQNTALLNIYIFFSSLCFLPEYSLDVSLSRNGWLEGVQCPVGQAMADAEQKDYCFPLCIDTTKSLFREISDEISINRKAKVDAR